MGMTIQEFILSTDRIFVPAQGLTALSVYRVVGE
jgi:hypothetical protein